MFDVLKKSDFELFKWKSETYTTHKKIIIFFEVVNNNFMI